MLPVQPVLGNVFLSVLHSFLTTLLTKPLISAHECPDIILPSYLFSIPGSLPGSYRDQFSYVSLSKLSCWVANKTCLVYRYLHTTILVYVPEGYFKCKLLLKKSSLYNNNIVFGFLFTLEIGNLCHYNRIK